MTYLQKLLKALQIEGYSNEELAEKEIPFLEKLIDQTMGKNKFNLMADSWAIFDTI